MSEHGHLDLLRYFALPGARRVYVLGAGESRVTVKSQQVRALNLTYALSKARVLTADSKVAVVGGGFAGLTAAAAAASLGAKVTVYEQEAELLKLQMGATQRRLHPNLFDWPQEGATARDAGLPLLSWTADSAQGVRDQVLAAWNGLAADVRNRIDVQRSVTVTGVGDDATVQSRRKPSPVVLPNKFDIAVVAVGFGSDGDGHSNGYWQLDNVEQGHMTGQHAVNLWAISGNGDGGLVDCLRICLGAPDGGNAGRPPLMDWIETFVELVPQSLCRQLRVMEEEAAHMEPNRASEHFDAEYRRLLLAGLDDLRAELRKRMRAEDRVLLIGSTPEAYNPRSNALNRFVLAMLFQSDPERTRIQYVQNEGPRSKTATRKLLNSLKLGQKAQWIWRQGPKATLHKVVEDKMRLERMSRDFVFARQRIFTDDAFVPRGPVEPARLSSKECAHRYAPLFADEVETVLKQKFLGERLQRRGILGFGHYACETEADARHLAATLLAPTAPDRPVAVVKLEMPSTSADWDSLRLTSLPNGKPEDIQATFNVASVRTTITAGDRSYPLYCYYLERVGQGASEVRPTDV